MADGVQELLVRVRADTADALAGMNKVSAGLQAAVAQATKAGASFNDLTAASRATSAAFGQARTDEARAQFAALAAEVAETQAAMLSAATAAPTLADRLDEAVRAVYATEASLEDVAQAARLADQALQSASTDEARAEYAFLAAELQRVREGMVTLAQVGTQGGPSPAALQALVGAAQGASASLDDVARAQQAVDAAFRASRTDEERAEYAALSAALQETGNRMRGVSGSGDRFARSAGGANLALQGLARAANDSISFQYGLQQGLIATANQVDQLVFAYSRMKEVQAETGQSIRSQLRGALSGAHGLMLGLNVAMTAVILAGPLLSKVFGDAADEADRLKEAGSGAADALVDIQIETRKARIETAAQLRALIEAAQAQRDAETADFRRARSLTFLTLGYGGLLTSLTQTKQELQEGERALNSYDGFLENLRGRLAQVETQARLAAGAISQVGTAFPQDEGEPHLGAFAAAVAQGNFDFDNLFLSNPYAPRGRGAGGGGRGGERTLADILKDLRQAQAATQALFTLGVIGPAEAAEAAASNLRAALDGALDVSGGESTQAVRDLSAELIAARNEARALAKEQDRLNEIKEQSILADQNLRQAARSFRLPTREVFESPKPPDWFKVLGVDGLRDAVDNGLIRTLRDAESVYDSLRAAFAAATTDEARDEIRALMEQVEALIGAMEGGITVAERYGFALANAVGQAAGQGVYDLLFGPEMTEAQRQLREFEFGLDGEALREQFAEGSIGAEEFRLRMEALREEQAAFAAQFDPLKRAANGFFDAMKRGIADMIADLVRATATALVLKYVLGPLLGVSTGGFGAILGGLLGISGGAGKNGAAGAAPAAVQARELATAQAQGGTIVFRPEVGEFRVSNGYLLASVRAALAEERRSGRGSGAL